MLARYKMFAAYNGWANQRLYDTAAKLSDPDYRKDRGAFFRSVHGTLNHLLAGDRIWMKRFTCQGEMPPSLDAILHDDFSSLRKAREAEDKGIVAYADKLDGAQLAGELRYRTVVNPKTVTQPLVFALDHFFNHQTHHRGQAHALLTSFLGNEAVPSFDLIIFQRETGLGGLRSD
jgi:uncharacterized damage-inducible protein DinB